jgi:hypothetical protein
MFHRVAMSEQYRSDPTSVRARWAFCDFIAAHVILDIADEERARAQREASRGR